MTTRILIPTLLSVWALAQTAQGVIVAGASGGFDNSNNTTAAQYLSETGTALNVYDHVVQFGGGSAVYLGYDAATREVWVLTARHINVGGAATVTIDGLSYDYQSDSIVGDGDLRVVKYKRADNQVPSLTALTLSNTVPPASTALVMIGYGRNRTEAGATNPNNNDSTTTGTGLTGYHWDASRIQRWGTNVVEDLGGGVTLTSVDLGIGYNTTTFVTDFDEPANGQWLNSNEAQGSNGDSGGGAFIYSNGQWVLAGLMSAVSIAGDSSTASFTDATYITDVSSYYSGIQSAIGVTLIPEPASTSMLAALTLMLALRRKR